MDSGAGLAGVAALCLIYCMTWLAFDEFNKREDNALYTAAIAQNTPRHGLIVVTGNLTPDGMMQPKMFSSTVDRKIMAAADWEGRRNETGRGMEVFFSRMKIRQPVRASSRKANAGRD